MINIIANINGDVFASWYIVNPVCKDDEKHMTENATKKIRVI